MSDPDRKVRGLTAPLFIFLYLPSGLTQGFVTVTLSYILANRDVSVAAIAGLVSLNLLPWTWKFLVGPVLDMTLSSVRWFMICIGVTAAIFVALAFAPLDAAGMPLLSVLSLALGAAGSASGSSATAAMALTTPNEHRGSVAAWQQAGALGGVGLGGGVGIWLPVHAGGPRVAALTLAAVCLLCALPMLRMHVPAREPGIALRTQARNIGRSVWILLSTRRGILVSLIVVQPSCLGAASNLFGAIAGDWRASADLVAVVTGMLGGLASVPGCIFGGYLCDRFPRRTFYIFAALANAGGEVLMALAPHTPFWFAAMALANQFLLGVGFSALSAVIFESLRASGAATISSVLSSLGNLPVVVMTMVVGWVQTRQGSTAMLLTEASVAVIAITAYAVLAYVWRSTHEVALPALETTRT